MTRARTVVKQALITCQVVSPDEDPDESESTQGLYHLNLLIDSLNQKGLWPYTPMYKVYTPEISANQFTIGEGEGKLISSITSDGFTVTVTTSREATYYDGDTVAIYDTQNFDTLQSKAISVFSPNQFSYPEDYVVNITSTTDGSGIVTVVTSSPHGYTSGDSVRITDGFNYNQTNTATVVDATTFTLPITLGADYTSGVTAKSADIVTKARETTGYSFKYGDLVPDIRSPRPRKITDIILENNQSYVLKSQPHNQFDAYGYIKSSGRPYAYTYVPSAPFGVIKFDKSFGSAYPLTIKYDMAIEKYDLDTEITTASGYEGFFVYELACKLGRQYGKDVSAIEVDAKGYRDRLYTNNAINLETVMDTDSPVGSNGNFDIISDRII